MENITHTKEASGRIEEMIIKVRGVPVILDKDIAQLYGVETRRLNEQVKRNADRFPEDFMFRLTTSEFKSLISQFATSNRGGTRKAPLAFTEYGVAMLSSVLNSQTAIQINIQIMRAFIKMRTSLSLATVSDRVLKLEIIQQKQQEDLRSVFELINNKQEFPSQGIFHEGQIFDAYVFVSKLIKKAEKQLILIDNYIDESVLLHLTKRNKGVKVEIYTCKRNYLLLLDESKYKAQYGEIVINECNNVHDRFLIADDEVYHIGGSLKDLGKKVFAFSKLELSKELILCSLK